MIPTTGLAQLFCFSSPIELVAVATGGHRADGRSRLRHHRCAHRPIHLQTEAPSDAYDRSGHSAPRAEQVCPEKEMRGSCMFYLLSSSGLFFRPRAFHPSSPSPPPPPFQERGGSTPIPGERSYSPASWEPASDFLCTRGDWADMRRPFLTFSSPAILGRGGGVGVRIPSSHHQGRINRPTVSDYAQVFVLAFWTSSSCVFFCYYRRQHHQHHYLPCESLCCRTNDNAVRIVVFPVATHRVGAVSSNQHFLSHSVFAAMIWIGMFC